MENLADVKPVLCEDSGPAKFEWLLGIIPLVVMLVSFCSWDASAIIMYQVRFAQAILHGNLSEAYFPKVITQASNGWGFSSFSVYELPTNLLCGIWGIPLYLWSARNGTLEITYPQSFLQMIYGKCFMLSGLIFSAIVLYKVCRAMKLDEKRSSWGAYIYLTSVIAINGIALKGQVDAWAVAFTLLGFRAYIKKDYKKFLFWMIIATQFKQFAIVVFFPLLILREKNLLRITGYMLLMFIANFLFNLPLLLAPGVLNARSSFAVGMYRRFIVDNMLPLFRSDVSAGVFLIGIFCIYCWFREPEEDDERKFMSRTLFTALTSMIIFFTSFNPYDHNFINMIPYIAISIVFYRKYSDKIILFEAVGMAALAVSCYLKYPHEYLPNNANNMLLHNLIGRPEFPSIARISQAIKSYDPDAEMTSRGIEALIVKLSAGKMTRAFADAVYCVCMYTIVWLCSEYNKLRSGGGGLRYFVLLRLLLNCIVCSIPIILIFIPALRR